MKEIRRKPFEYYADKAAYDKYMHTNEYDEEAYSEEYCALPAIVFEHVFAKAQNDWDKNEDMASKGQFGEYMLKEGGISKNNLDCVIDELFHDYKLDFKVIKDNALRRRRSQYI